MIILRKVLGADVNKLTSDQRRGGVTSIMEFQVRTRRSQHVRNSTVSGGFESHLVRTFGGDEDVRAGTGTGMGAGGHVEEGLGMGANGVYEMDRKYGAELDDRVSDSGRTSADV